MGGGDSKPENFRRRTCARPRGIRRCRSRNAGAEIGGDPIEVSAKVEKGIV